MASMHEEEVIEIQECANCGATEGLLKCSRCHTAWFCGVQCQKAYWPFHKAQCRRNEFADMIEESEPKFARWMRSHGKLAVLKDDEVDRLERSSTAVSGPSRQDVMESMYGRLEPKPREASYTAEERAAMRRRQEEEAATERRTALLSSSFQYIDIPKDLGLDCGNYKWRQSQSHVEIFLPIPDGISTSKTVVSLRPRFISIEFDEKPLLKGTLYRNIKTDDSTWYIQDRVLEILLVKHSRRGHYADGETNADTFWMSVLASAHENEVLQLTHPPVGYYWSPCEDDDAYGTNNNRTGGRRMLPARTSTSTATKSGYIDGTYLNGRGGEKSLIAVEQ